MFTGIIEKIGVLKEKKIKKGMVELTFWLDEMWIRFGDWVSRTWNTVATFFSSLPGKIKTWLSGVVTAASEKSPYKLAARVRQLFNYNQFFRDESAPLGREYILGFAGFWIMADEAHITNIAVRNIHRCRGIGELLLISMIDLATELNARNLTLEVRASNTAAQKLYSKYGFSQVGLRHGYYTDNKEDAVLMSTEDIISVSFQSRLNQLKKAHSPKYGIALYRVAR